MKIATNINQSKELAEILHKDSADMCYTPIALSFNGNSEPKLIAFPPKHPLDIPCWSLSGLLDVLPTYLFEFDRGIDLNVYPNLNGRGWHCSYMPNCTENMKTDKFKLITSEDNLIDACVEMIIKLHEQKLL